MTDEHLAELLRRRGDELSIRAADRLEANRINWEQTANRLHDLQSEYSGLSVDFDRLLYAANVALGYLPMAGAEGEPIDVLTRAVDPINAERRPVLL